MKYGKIILLAFIIIHFSSCAELLFVAEEEMLVTRAVGTAAMEETAFVRASGLGVRMIERAGMAERMAAFVIEDERLFFSSLARVRMTETVLRNPRLYVLENGLKTEFATVSGTTEFEKTAIRFLKDGVEVGEEYSLPGRLYRVNSKTELVNVRDARGLHGKVYTHKVYKDQLILVMERHPINGWYRVKTGMNNGEEFLSAALLAPLYYKSADKLSATRNEKKKKINYLLICQKEKICGYLNPVEDILHSRGCATEKNGFVSYMPDQEELVGYYDNVILLDGSEYLGTSSISDKAVTATFQFNFRIYNVKEKRFTVSKNEKVVALGFSEAEVKNKIIEQFSEKIKTFL